LKALYTKKKLAALIANGVDFKAATVDGKLLIDVIQLEELFIMPIGDTNYLLEITDISE
jgi:hypothetical protein